MKNLHRIGFLAALIAWAGCGSGAPNCLPGAQVTCACPGGAEGVQVCSADGASLGACGCGTGSEDSVDTDVAASHDTDNGADTDSIACTELTLGEVDIHVDHGSSGMMWTAPVSPDLGDGAEQTMSFTFLPGIEPSLAGTFDLAAGNQANYQTCAACVDIVTRTPDGELARRFFQAEGHLTLDEDPLLTRHFNGHLSSLRLIEVTVDPNNFFSTPVPGGACVTLASADLNADAAPAGWTCDGDAYNDGVTCDCACGLDDPDCALQAAPVTGCDVGDVCQAGSCASPMPNDTCASASTVVVGTPISGSSWNATNTFDAGLEDPSCTSLDQPGADVAYAITLTLDQTITVTVTPTDPSFDLALALVGPGAPSVCDASPIDCLVGVDTPTDGAAETIEYTATAAGTYYILVDSYTSGGPFVLEITSP